MKSLALRLAVVAVLVGTSIVGGVASAQAAPGSTTRPILKTGVAHNPLSGIAPYPGFHS